MLVGWCDPGTTDGAFTRCMVSLARERPEYEFIRVEGSRVDHQRNELVRSLLASEHEWMLMVDSDMTFSVADVDEVQVAAADVDARMVTGLICNAEGQPVVARREGHAYRLLDHDECKSQFVDACGAAFLLVHREVYEAVGRNYKGSAFPWFLFTEYQGRRLGEDFEFCRRAREAGYPIWLEASADIGHMKRKETHAHHRR